MKTETIDDEDFVITTPEEQKVLELAWTTNGGTTEDVGNGIKLFIVGEIVAYRTREDQTN